MINYDDWLEENYEELTIMAAESGADRELDFDFDTFAERQFDEYLDKWRKI